MNIDIEKSELKGTVGAIASKAYAHRMIIAASLAENPSKIVCNQFSEDINATIDCMKKLGAEIIADGSIIEVTPINKSAAEGRSVNIDCNESGSTLRFVLPVAAALGADAEISGRGRLAERPLGDMLDVLREHEAVISGEKLPLRISGKLKAGDYSIRGDISSQYITGLLLALPILGGDSTITVTGGLKSRGYVDITLKVMSDYSVRPEVTDFGYRVFGGGAYRAGVNSVVEGDWSNAAFWLVGGAVNGDVSVTGLNPESAQGDMRIIEILNDMGAKINIKPEISSEYSKSFRVVKSDLKPIKIDISDIPDLAPILAVACAAADGMSELRGVERLRLKESDRLAGIMSMLSAVGIKCAYENDLLSIFGGLKSENTGKHIVLDGMNDHRMVMASAVFGSMLGGVTVTDKEAVNKSYPRFFDDLKMLSIIRRQSSKIICDRKY